MVQRRTRGALRSLWGESSNSTVVHPDAGLATAPTPAAAPAVGQVDAGLEPVQLLEQRNEDMQRCLKALREQEKLFEEMLETCQCLYSDDLDRYPLDIC
jgi:hypothetical protein